LNPSPKNGEGFSILEATMKNIRLTSGLEATVDDEDFEQLRVFIWDQIDVEGKTYACRVAQLPDGGEVIVLMHDDVMRLARGKKLLPAADTQWFN
jgi:hypothetical protein